MKYCAVLAVFFLLFASLVHGENGETPSSYLYENTRLSWYDAYSFGMGGTSVGFGNGPAYFGNPSSAAFSPFLQLSAGMGMYFKIKDSSEYSYKLMYGSISHPIRDWFVFTLNGGQMKIADDTVNMVSGTFSRYADFSSVQFAFGFTGKYVSQTIDTPTILLEDGSGFGGDLSLMLKFPFDAEKNSFNIGANFVDIFSGMDVAMGTNVGAGVEFKHQLFGGAKLNIGGDYGMNYTDNTTMRFGAEEWFLDNMFALKAGYLSTKQGDIENNIITAGLSVAYNGFTGSFGYGLGNDNYDGSMTFEVAYTGKKTTPTINQKIAPKIQIYVNNDVFSPNGDGLKDQVRFRLESAEASLVKVWKLTVSDENKKDVKTFTGKNGIPAFLTWDGKNDKEDPLADGIYYAVMDITDKYKNSSKSNELKIIMKRTAPTINLSAVPQSLAVGNPEPLKFVVSLLDPIDVRTTKIIIKAGDVVIHTIEFNGTKDSYEWNGMLENNTFVTEGQTLSVFAELTDKGDNVGKSSVINLPVVKYTAPVVTNPVVTPSLPPVYLASRIRFAESSFTLTQAAKDELNKIIAMVKQNPNSKIRVEGHTDNVGAASVNYKLSRQRADIVKNYIVKEGGIEESRVASVGYGPDMPIDTNGTAQGKANNRRVDVIILSY